MLCVTQSSEVMCVNHKEPSKVSKLNALNQKLEMSKNFKEFLRKIRTSKVNMQILSFKIPCIQDFLHQKHCCCISGPLKGMPLAWAKLRKKTERDACFSPSQRNNTIWPPSRQTMDCQAFLPSLAHPGASDSLTLSFKLLHTEIPGQALSPSSVPTSYLPKPLINQQHKNGSLNLSYLKWCCYNIARLVFQSGIWEFLISRITSHVFTCFCQLTYKNCSKKISDTKERQKEPWQQMRLFGGQMGCWWSS